VKTPDQQASAFSKEVTAASRRDLILALDCMSKNREKNYHLAGLYVAAALLAYAVVGALLNDLYIPGRRTDGTHLHYESIAPAAVAIACIAAKFALTSFKTNHPKLIQSTLTALAIAFFLASLYYVVRPSGARIATQTECHETFERLSAFVTEFDQKSIAAKILLERGQQCPDMPILKTYHECVMRARSAADTNDCASESEALLNRKNAT
jgi:hypothetical protein